MIRIVNAIAAKETAALLVIVVKIVMMELSFQKQSYWAFRYKQIFTELFSI